MNSKEIKNFLLNLPSEEKVYVYMGTYLYNRSGEDFRVSRDECGFFTPSYSLYRELKSEEELKIELYKEQMFELDNVVIRTPFDTMVESNKYFNYLREQYLNFNNENTKNSFVKIYQPNTKKTK